MATPAPVDPNKPIRIARFFAYPKQELYLIASFIFLISLVHFISLGYRYLTRRRVYPTRSSNSSGEHVQLGRLPTAIADTLRAVTFRWTVPLGFGYTLNLAEVGLTAGYIGVLFSWTFVNTTNLQGMIADPKYFANRAGTIAASQVPIMVALGTRNNVLSALTGVSFDKLNYLHRVSARVICILAWIHGGGRITVGLTDDETINHRWVRCGPLAASALTLLCILSVRPARDRAYEVFLAMHLTFALIFMLGMLFHLTGRTLTYYGAWPAFIVWGVDRAIRVGQLLIYNFKKPALARVTALSQHFLRITIPRPRAMPCRPGQSAFLSFPSVPGGWPLESHPFTVATLSGDLVFILRVRNGITRRLLNAADASTPVLITGPTSAPPLLIAYQRVVLIAGGSGVAFTLPLLLDLIRQAKNGETSCQHVLFVWAVRDIDHVSWINDLITPALLDNASGSSLDIKILFYTTAASDETSSADDVEKWAGESADDGDTATSTKETPTPPNETSISSLLALPFVQVLRGRRPDVDALLKEEIAAATGRVSVNVCGTHSLAESVRRALRTPRPMDILHGGPTVTLHVEAFGTGA